MRMGQRVRADRDRPAQHLAHLIPGERRQRPGALAQHAERAAQGRGRDEDRGGNPELGQDREGVLVVVGKAVVEGDRHRPRRELLARLEGAHERAQRDDPVAAVPQVLHLLAEGASRDARAVQLVVDPVVVQHAGAGLGAIRTRHPEGCREAGAERGAEHASRSRAWREEPHQPIASRCVDGSAPSRKSSANRPAVRVMSNCSPMRRNPSSARRRRRSGSAASLRRRSPARRRRSFRPRAARRAQAAGCTRPAAGPPSPRGSRSECRSGSPDAPDARASWPAHRSERAPRAEHSR